jgi:hypothetical protein
MRVFGLAVAGMLALTTPMKQVVPAPGNVQVWGGCGLGVAPSARSLEPVERRMGSAALRTGPLLWLVGSLWWLG